MNSPISFFTTVGSFLLLANSILVPVSSGQSLSGLISSAVGGFSDGGSKSATGSVSKMAATMTNMTSQQANCPLVSINVVIALVTQQCNSNTTSADECMRKICDDTCKKSCPTALIRICIEIILGLQLIGSSIAGMKLMDPSYLLNIALKVLASINIPLI